MKPATTANRPLWPFVLLGAVVLFVVIVRVRLMGLPLERDEGEYAYFGQLLLQGVPPYAAAYSMKMPGTYVVYAAVMALAGQSAAAIRLGLLVVNLATMALVFLLGRRLVDEETGAVAAAAYGVMALSTSVMGFAAHATHFVVLFAVAGLWLLVRAIDAGRHWPLAASGALLGVAFTMKQHGVVFAAFGATWLLWNGLRSSSASPRAAWGRLAAFLAGAAVPVAGVLAALFAAGVFAKFWFWNVVYAGHYATSSTLAQGMDNLVYQLGHMRPLAGFAALAALGLLVAAWDERARRAAPFLGGLLAFSSLAVVPGLYFRDHYFIQMLPAVALLAGVAVTAVARTLDRGTAIAACVLAIAWAAGSDYAHAFRMSPVAFCRAVYGSNPFPEAVDVAAYVKANTRPGDRIAVLGSEPEIYFESGRRGATGHIYMYGLMEEQPYALTMQKELAAEVEAARPPIVVVVNVSTSWILRAGSENQVFAWAASYLAADYEKVGLIEIADGPSKAVWGAEAGREPRSDDYIAVYRRKRAS